MRFIIALAITAAFLSPLQQFTKDPLKEMQKRAEKEASEKNYKELKDAAAELADLSKQISADIPHDSHVIELAR